MQDFTKTLLLNYKVSNTQTQEFIIRNVIARGANCLNSIHLLWKSGNIQDCWILYRTLIDRLFHLSALAEKNEFEVFEKWSFIQQFEYTNRVRSDPQFNSRIEAKDFSLSKENKERYSKLKKENITWQRSKAENIAKDNFNMPFLYTYAYDYASGLVHPLATDGIDDFEKIANGKLISGSGYKVVIHNSILIQTMILQEGLNASTFKWRRIVYDFISQCRKSIETGEKTHIKTLARLINAGRDFDWCQIATPDKL